MQNKLFKKVWLIRKMTIPIFAKFVEKATREYAPHAIFAPVVCVIGIGSPIQGFEVANRRISHSFLHFGSHSIFIFG